MNTDTDDLDDIKTLWSAQPHGRMKADVSEILNEVRHKDARFRRTIFWRDVQEVGVGLILLPVWLWLGGKYSLPWTWYLSVPGMLWIIGFLLVTRYRQRRKQGHCGESLKEFVDHSISDVDHQIWLLRNVFWWYLLPIILPICAFLFHVAVRAGGAGGVAFGRVAAPFSVVLLVCGAVYWINQRAIRRDLRPRREELDALSHDLETEPRGEDV